MSELKIVERQVNNVTILDLMGDITFGHGNTLLRYSIRSLLAEGKKNILLNFAETGFLDSSGIGEIASGYIAINRENGRLKLMNLTSRARQVLAITKLLRVFETFENEDDAVNSFEEQSILIS